MTTFVDAINNQEARTENGMKARKSTANSVTDFFFKVGASRGQDVIPMFIKAQLEDTDKAIRIAQWARDVRGGAGERQIFKDILVYLSKHNEDVAIALIDKTPTIGRWDDLLIDFQSDNVRNYAFETIKKALNDGNALCAKWMPRKGAKAVELRKFLGWSPKRYRKTLVNLTKVVETQMCENKWDDINFEHVPSLASARYRNAFTRHTPKFNVYVEKLSTGEAKVNTGAVYPYDVIKSLDVGSYWRGTNLSKTEEDFIINQWDALENFVGDASVLPMIDVSGSMGVEVGGNNNLTCMQVAISLGLYVAEKNKGVFKDAFLTFSGSPSLEIAKGNIIEKVRQAETAHWAMSTNLHKAFDVVLDSAVNSAVPESEMPKTLIIFSDMQFDSCVSFDDSAMEMIRRKYEDAGYELPKIVFWNLNAYDNVPVKFDERGVALVSGFSPSLMKSIFSDNLDSFTPESVMLETIMDERYNWS